ncbi:MAG: hypothetical protein HOQ38_06730 [Nonomuraea sp.]|nr:hypothetical protein [Nonomuraea sp.]
MHFFSPTAPLRPPHFATRRDLRRPPRHALIAVLVLIAVLALVAVLRRFVFTL